MMVPVFWAQSSPRPKPRPTFQGKVVNAATGQPIPEATIVLAVPPERHTSPPPTRVTNTDAKGRFALWAVPTGAYLITASRRGFVDMGATGPYIKVPSESNEEIVFRLVPQAIIRGTVEDEDGVIPTGASVNLRRREFHNGGSHYKATNEARVRADGTFVLGGILPGHYYLAASSAPTGAIEPRQERTTIDTFFPDESDQASARLIEIAAGQELNGITIRLKSERLYSVRGHLSEIEKGSFQFFPRGGASPNQLRPIVNSNGSFEIRLRTGDYLIVGSATQKSPPKSTVSIYQTVTVRGDMETLAIHATDTTRTIRGTVRTEPGQNPGWNGSQPIFLLSSMISDWSNQGYGVNEDGSFQGDYMSHSLVDGEVRAGLYLPNPELYVKSIRFNGSDVTHQPFRLPYEGGEFDVSLASSAAGVSGVVQTAKGRRDKASCVTIWSTNEPVDGSSAFSATVPLGEEAKGSFQLENLPPGEYRINAWAEVGLGLASYPEFFKAFGSTAIRLTLKSGTQATVTLTAIPSHAWESQAWKLR